MVKYSSANLLFAGEESLTTKLRRSFSVPSKNVKQKVFRTGSHVVAGTTLDRLKLSIRNGTSAALIRKPSITGLLYIYTYIFIEKKCFKYI